MHLRYDYITAYHMGETRHAEYVMERLGIKYTHATPQSIADQFWFWNCENVPKNLPSFITILDVNPKDCIGWGLSKEQVDEIINKE